VSYLVLPFSSINDFKLEFKSEHEIFRKSVREFVEREVIPRIAEMEKTGTVPRDLHEKAAQQGFFGIDIPIEYGGQGGDNLMMVLLCEELCRAYPALSTYLLVHGLFTYPVLKYGTEDQKRKYLPPIASGEKLAAHASTEASGGSDPAGMQATAKKINNHWILTGRKIFITSGDVANYYLVPARTSPPPSRRERWRGITCFIVERDWKGVSSSRMEMVGLRASHTAEVIFDDVKVPEENVLGPVGEGFKILMDTYDHGRIGVAAQAVGLTQNAFEKSLNYALQRNVFERPIISYQAIQFYLADMLTELFAARFLTYWAAYLADQGRPEAVFIASIAKAYATEVAERAAIKTINIHAGYGVAVENYVDMLLRDAEIMKIYEGTNEIQRMITIRQLLKKVFGVDLLGLS